MSTVETVRFICGGCGYRARIPASYTGKVILCPGCQQMQIASADAGEATGDTVRVSKVATAPGTGRFSVPDADGRLRFTCTGCGYSAKLASTYAGKAISCPQCKAPQVIPPLQAPEDGAGKAQPSPALEPATAATAAPSADDGLSFDDEPAKPAKPAAAATAKPGKPAPAPMPVSDDDGLTFSDEPAGRSAPDASDNDATKPTAAASAKPQVAKTPVKPTAKPGSGGVVRRGNRMALPVAAAAQDEDDEDEDDGPQKPARPLPPWAQKLKEPRMMMIIGGCAAALILQVVLISGWAGASGDAETYRQRAEDQARQAGDLGKQKAETEFALSKATEELNRVKKAESEAKAALAATEIRLVDLGEQLKKAEADKADEYARRKKAEADHDEMFAKLKAVEKKRDDEYRIATELRRKFEEEAKLRKDLKARLDEVQAAK